MVLNVAGSNPARTTRRVLKGLQKLGLAVEAKNFRAQKLLAKKYLEENGGLGE